MKILLTGGHVTPALAVIDELQKKVGIDILFVGRKYALYGDKTESFEYQEVLAREIRFVDVHAGRLSFTSAKNILTIPRGFVEAFLILKKEKSDVILSFGGYIAFPLAICACLFGIPVFTHEQVLAPGLTNKIIARFAKKVFVTFPQSESYFSKKNTIVTGNPIRESIFKVQKKPFLIEKKSKKIVYITGGSLGSHVINMSVLSSIDTLLEKYIVIHQCGDASEYNDFERLSHIKHADYHLAKHFFDDEIGFIYANADVVVSRAGANTILELIALKKPSILVPLPIARNDEQLAHAKLLKAVGAAEIIGQNSLDDNLLGAIDRVASSLETRKRNFDKLQYIHKKDAAKKIIAEILK